MNIIGDLLSEEIARTPMSCHRNADLSPVPLLTIIRAILDCLFLFCVASLFPGNSVFKKSLLKLFKGIL